jgi:hypothetical protein
MLAVVLLFLLVARTESFLAPTKEARQLSLHTLNGQRGPPLTKCDDVIDENNSDRRQLLAHFWQSGTTVLLSTASVLLSNSRSVSARLEGVNRPDLLPKEPNLTVMQTEKILTSGQVKRMNDLLKALERDTGYRVRVLCQAYPLTPGLAIRDYWDLGKDGQQDDKYVVLVADQFGGKSNVLNFNVGDGVKFALPNVFWTRLQNKFGTVSFFAFSASRSVVIQTHILAWFHVLMHACRHFMFERMVLT